MVTIYEWKVPCKTTTTRTKRMKQITSVRQELEHYLESGLSHPNLVQYLEMSYQVSDINVTVEVVSENIRGGNLKELLLNQNTGGPLVGQTLQHYSRQLLEALHHLHNRGIVHNDLKPSLVMVDPVRGILKLCGYTIIKRLSDLVNPIGRNEEGVSWPVGLKDYRGGKRQDILKMGMIVLCMALGNPSVTYPPVLPPHLPDQVQDFINRCLEENENRKYLSHDLLSHSFVTPSPQFSQLLKPNFKDEPGIPLAVPIGGQQLPYNTTNIGNTTNGFDSTILYQPPTTDNCIVVGSPADFGSEFRFSSTSFCRSRLGTDFDEIENLGSGGLGYVMKVKNRLDGRFFSINNFKLYGGSKMMDKITREVELLSQMNHENIVRYYNAWIESFESFSTITGDSSDDEDDDDSDSTFDSSPSSSDDDDDSEGEIDDSLFIEFRPEPSSIRKLERNSNKKQESDSLVEQERDPDSSRELFDLSMDDEDSMIIGAQQLEANLMDLSPSRLKRDINESSEAIVFQDSSSTKEVPIPSTSPITEENKKRSKRKDTGQIQYLYIQMEYCPNETVRQLIDSGQLHKRQNGMEWQLFREMLEGLAHIHAQGMIHRDLKPGNIFLNSSGHIKIGDFGLAISLNKQHPAFSRSNSVSANPGTLVAANTGIVGTALYLAPEVEKAKNNLKYSPKVDIYSLGIIFFEMCHPPLSTQMERVKIITEMRKEDIVFPDTFDHVRMSKQAHVIRWLLNHSPQKRPTSKELLQSHQVPFKIVDKELQEVFTRTLQNPNSSRYRRLIDELFSQQNPKLMEHTFFTDPMGQDSTKGFDKVKASCSYAYCLLRNHVRSIATNVFNRHCALNFQTPLLGPSYPLLDTSSTARLMDSTGRILSLPAHHWVSFSRHVFHQNITSTKRYSFNKTFLSPNRIGTHPKETEEYFFDVVTLSTKVILPAAEVIAVVLEIISDLSLIQHGVQLTLWINHTSLTTAILNYCSIPNEQHNTVRQILHNIMIGEMNSSDFEKTLKEKENIQLSPLALKTFLKWIDSEIPLSEVVSSLQLLIKCRDSVSGPSREAISEMKNLCKQLVTTQVKVCVHPGLVLKPEYFQGLMFQFMQQDISRNKKKKKKCHSLILAVGGQYDKLVDDLRKSAKLVRESFGGGRDPSSFPAITLFGVSIREETIMKTVCSLFGENQSSFPVSNCQALICWLGRESLDTERKELVKDLRDRGVSVDTPYDTMTTLEEIQQYCKRRFIPHIVLLERALWIKQQVTVRTLESGRGCDKVASEKVIGISELPEYIQVKFGTEKSDSAEVNQVQGSGSKSVPGSADVSAIGSGSLPSVSITTVGRQKLQGNVRRRMDSQTLTKLLPLLQTYSPKYSIEIIVVDFGLEPLCLLTAELNKVFGSGKTDLTNTIKTLTERDNTLGKKYVAKVCESIQEKISEK